MLGEKIQKNCSNLFFLEFLDDKSKNKVFFSFGRGVRCCSVRTSAYHPTNPPCTTSYLLVPPQPPQAKHTGPQKNKVQNNCAM